MIKSVIQSHLFRYQAMQIQDLYKLLHQAAMGSEHAVADPESARHWLARELLEMDEGPLEPLVDIISADGDIARIHLRPFVESGHDPDLLLEPFIRTANEYHGETCLLKKYWQAAVALADFPTAKMDEFFHSMEKQSFPAVHHSPEYRLDHRPAYRIVALAFCPGSWL